MGGFKVSLKRKEVVATVLPLQEQYLQLSNLDLLLPPLDVGVFFCYQKPRKQENLTFTSMVRILKKALSEALVSYYPLSGEIVINSVGEPMLLCNNRGVDFIEACADVDLQDVQFYNPDSSLANIVPERKEGVLCVQATELRCGAILVACTFDHRVVDAHSANMFLVAWAELVQSRPISIIPSFTRSLLNPRSPTCYDPSFDDMYVAVPRSMLPPPTVPKPGADHLISRIYYVRAQDIDYLQSLSNSNNYKKRSKIESFSAFLWKIIAKTSSDDAERCKMGIVVDGRRRLSNGVEDTTCSMVNYFGNVLSIPFGKKAVGDLKTKPLDWVANVVHDYLKDAVTKEHFLGLIDWVEEHRPEAALATIYCSKREDGPAFVVSSGQGFPVSKVDFGWGRPVFGSYHFPWNGEAGYVMPMPSSSGNGDWIVYMHLLKGQLEFLEVEASDVFRPLTSDYLGLSV
ncbi:PREDICTED: shikimate O-hydroxycinnamoyltransferase-like [Nelumbo nucifera]|uniref:Shikimate O-hydroxycinnamoyltransferase-like n=2 Tax=Nelumbo nucifera TaxID=4432 RepID=A0A1U7ZSH8_NELNU|nr:PREDICTED: shikimate O-hydroxycinnamoyltransferase-like [Nelumbo nucifera]DAD43070.1 TPA_asm: hypothetical protein HUJ06_001300 [Nelumbo nucifera]